MARRRFNRFIPRPAGAAPAPAPAPRAPAGIVNDSRHQPLASGSYESISDFVAAIDQGACNSANEGEVKTYGESGRYGSWFGADCTTGADVRKLVRDGWTQGRDRLNELRSKMGEIEIAPQDRRRKMTRGDYGDVLDIHAVYAGRLDSAWSRPVRRSTQGPQRIELCANMLCSGGEHADVLFWRGAAAVVLADMLESAGYMVRLVVVFGGSNMAGEKVSCRITVKAHDMPLDITSTSAVILPGFFRALGHAWIAAHSRKSIGSAGISVEQGHVESSEVLLSHAVRDHGTALAFVNETIAAVNAGTLQTFAA